MPHAQTRQHRSLYEQLEALPAGLTGELLDGQLHVQPRPTARHIRAAARLDRQLSRNFDNDEEGQADWWIFPEPELHFIRDTEVEVPDLAGWRRERMPVWPDGHRFTVVPDWVCEVLSPSTASTDRDLKMPIYAQFGVSWAWLIDPRARTLEAYVRDGTTWRELGRFAGGAVVAAPPFDAMALDLGRLWGS